MKETNYPLEMEVIKLVDNQNPDDRFTKVLTLADCCRNFSVLGAVGSGKSSGFMAIASLAMASRNFSMIIPVAKTDELPRWKKIHKTSGSKGKFINWNKESNLKFDPLLYLSGIDGGMDTMNIVNLFISISKTINRINGYGGGFGNDSFWIREVSRLLKNVINLLKLSNQVISFENINMIISEMYVMKSDTKSPNTKNFPYLFDCMIKAQTSHAFDNQKGLVILTLHFIKKDFMNVPEKTSGNTQAMVMGLLDPFISGTLSEVMVGEVSEELKPEHVNKHGSMVLINFPILEQLEVGGIIQSVYMRLMCQAIERRDLNDCDRPCCLMIDEAQYHIDDHLIRAMSTGRSKRMIVCLASQSISGYLALIDGQRYKVKVDAFMANCITKICCNANDYETLEYYMKTVGKGSYRIQEQDSKNSKFHSKEKFHLEHSDFKKLKTGGAPNYITESIIVTSGLPDNRHYIKASFDQKIMDKL